MERLEGRRRLGEADDVFPRIVLNVETTIYCGRFELPAGASETLKLKGLLNDCCACHRV